MAEGAAIMLFYQVGELFQSYAVGKSRKSIAAMMDIAPDYANIEHNGELVEVDPDEVQVGDVIVVKPGERVPIDGIVVDGTSQLDTAALTGESAPRRIEVGGEVISGCINMTGVLRIRTTKLFGASTVSRILELVENASEKKARTENFITRFARVYTPIVTLAAVVITVVPPLLGMGAWADWILRGLTFLVVSCPCALVISVPLSFFGGIGGASRLGILVKGSNYLEALAQVDTVVFDKTGTLTSGTFGVVGVHPAGNIDDDQLLAMAAHAEAFSDHPIALSVKKAYLDEAPADSGHTIDQARIEEAAEESGHGVKATVDGHAVLVGNDKLMSAHGISCPDCELTGTILHVAIDGSYAGHIVIADVVKDDAEQAIADLHAAGVERCVMLTGDREEVARAVASKLGLDDLPRPAAARRQGRAGGAHPRLRPRQPPPSRATAINARAGPHPAPERGHRHGRHGLGCRHRGRRYRPHGRQAEQYRPRHPGCAQDRVAHRAPEHRVRHRREAAHPRARRGGHRQHVARRVRRRGRGRHRRYPNAYACDEARKIASGASTRPDDGHRLTAKAQTLRKSRSGIVFRFIEYVHSAQYADQRLLSAQLQTADSRRRVFTATFLRSARFDAPPPNQTHQSQQRNGLDTARAQAPIAARAKLNRT